MLMWAAVNQQQIVLHFKPFTAWRKITSVFAFLYLTDASFKDTKDAFKDGFNSSVTEFRINFIHQRWVGIFLFLKSIQVSTHILVFDSITLRKICSFLFSSFCHFRSVFFDVISKINIF